ncbi:MAG: hypothetical protein JF618_13660, partial [Leifsonia sp.]|nr:hypothetical protein [Leifsonia sp.]
GFRHQLSRVSDQIEENVHDAARVIAGFEEDLATLTKQHNEEREQLLQEQRQANADGASW